MKENHVKDNQEAKNIDEYISNFPEDVQLILKKLRKAIAKAAPDAEETIKYRMPTFVLYKRNLVHFAAFKNHIGFYPTPSAIIAFKDELTPYKQSKGAIQFPINEPIPLDLVRRIVEFRVKENLDKSKNKK